MLASALSTTQDSFIPRQLHYDSFNADAHLQGRKALPAAEPAAMYIAAGTDGQEDGPPSGPELYS